MVEKFKTVVVKTKEKRYLISKVFQLRNWMGDQYGMNQGQVNVFVGETEDGDVSTNHFLHNLRNNNKLNIKLLWNMNEIRKGHQI